MARTAIEIIEERITHKKKYINNLKSRFGHGDGTALSIRNQESIKNELEELLKEVKEQLDE
jgi:sugar-specific transcriptional regulator TrmB